MRRALLFACLLGGAIVHAPLRSAYAAEDLRLEVEASADARGCKTPEVLRAKVAERLGRDPFNAGDEGGERQARLRVVFARTTRWSAEIALFDHEGKSLGTRSLSHEGPTCEPLVTSVAVTIAVVLEELTPVEKPPPAPPPSPPEPPPPTEPTPPSPSPSDRGIEIDAAIGGAGAVGSAPAPSVGGEIAIGVARKRARLELGGRMFLPASSDGDVAVRTRLLYARLAPCYGLPVLSGCVVGAIGSVSGEAQGEGVASSRLAGRLYAAGGLGVLSHVFLVKDIVFLRAAVEVLFPFSRVGFDVGETRVWTLPIASAAGMLALGARLP